jgi:hypothetical protein
MCCSDSTSAWAAEYFIYFPDMQKSKKRAKLVGVEPMSTAPNDSEISTTT